MHLSPESVNQLHALVDAAVADGETSFPGATVVVVDEEGNDLFAYAAGKTGLESQKPMTLESVYWIASCTKMVAALACMQLVERGVLKLDDAEHLAGLCPELAEKQVLREDGSMEPQKRPITLRMLLTHTAGFGYSFWIKKLRNWSHPVVLNEVSGNAEDILCQPLVDQPGEGWRYSIGIDWAGLALERATGVRLNDYIQANICEPLGLKSMNMFPTPDMIEHLVAMHYRNPVDHRLHPSDHLIQRYLTAKTPEEKAGCFHTGGAGLFTKPQDFCRVISVLLNDGTCPRTGATLLQRSTVEEMFKNQIPQFPDFAAQPMGDEDLGDAQSRVSNPVPHLHADVEPGTEQGWGLSFMLTGGRTGRSPGTACWSGLPNVWWWCDRQRGVGGIVCTQLVPFWDSKSLALRDDVERAVYQVPPAPAHI